MRALPTPPCFRTADPSGSWRVGRLRPLLAALLICIPAAAVGQTPVQRTSGLGVVAVAPPRTHAVLESVDGGIQEWLRSRLAVAEFDLAERGAVRAAVATLREQPEAAERPLRGADAPFLAALAKADAVLMTEVRFERGEVDVRMRVHSGEDGALIAGVRQTGPLVDLGTQLRDALGRLLAGMGARSPDIERGPAPRLSDLGRYQRAATDLELGRLVSAFRELRGLETPTAIALRREIHLAGASSQTPLSERSRLASARGVKNKDWLLVRKALSEEPDPAMLLAGGDAALARQEPDVAHRFYEQAAALDPASRDAQLGRARTAKQLGDAEAARQAFEVAVALDPEDPEPYEELGALDALPAAERAEHLIQAGELRSERLEPAAAESNFQEAGAVHRGVVGLATKNVALLNQRMGKHHEALLGLEEAAGAGLEDPELMAALGEERAHAGDLEGAEHAFTGALELEPRQPSALVGLGGVMQQTGRSREAIPILEQAKASAAKMKESREMLAMAYHATGDPDGALAALTTDVPPEMPTEDRAQLLVDAAQIEEQEGRIDQARIHLEQAQMLEPEDPPIHEALATVYEAQGELELANDARARVALLQGAESVPTTAAEDAMGESSPPTGRPEDFERLFASFPLTSPETRRKLGKVHYLGMVQPLDAKATALEWLLPFRPDLPKLDVSVLEGILNRYEVIPPPEGLPAVAQGAARRVLDFGTAREDIALLNDVLEVDATVIVRFTRVADGRHPWEEHYQVDARLVGGRKAVDVFILANRLSLPADGPFRAWNPRAALPASLILLILCLPLLRGWGTIVVQLDYKTGPGMKGFFSIQLRRRPGKVSRERQKGQSKSLRYQKRVASWSRFGRNMVDRVTTFRWVPARKTYVSIYGLLLDSRNEEVIGSYVEEKVVEVERGQTVNVAFNFTRQEAPLEVRLEEPEGAEEMPQVRVALAGAPETLRYVRDGTTVFHVPDGSYTVRIGEADRVHEVQAAIYEHRGATVGVKLGADDLTVFTGCPDAVEPYLLSDLTAAATALDRAGQADRANLLRALHHEERGEPQRAAKYYEAAGVAPDGNLDAIEIDDDELAHALPSAQTAAPSNEPRRAIPGDPLEAAAMYEAEYDYENAIEAYRSAGDTAKAIELLEKTERFYEAGTMCLDEDRERAIRLLEQVDLRDPDYSEACQILSELHAQSGEFGPAVAKFEEAMSVMGEALASPEMRWKHGELLERADRIDDALVAYEAIEKKDAAYPGLAEKLAELRGRLGNTGTVAQSRPVVDPRAPTEAPAPEEDRYELIAEVGRGGMGVVYKARDRRLGRVVALKRLPENLRDHPTAVRLFLREARAAAALNHPNIVTLFDADQYDGNYYITMEFLEGLPLDAILRKRGKLALRDALRLSVQIATGLQYAHEAGVIHRDIKTSNLFFTKDKVVKIMDFGLAKMVEEVRRAATVIGGTPYYMAPEQSAGESVDHRADLYAFGVTLYELLTGRVPFTEGDVAYHHRHTPPPDPRELVPDLPEAPVALIERLMAKSADDRPARTAEVTAALQALLRG